MVINSGILENQSTNYAAYAVDNNSTSNDVKLTVNGGTLYCPYNDAVRLFCNSTTKKNEVIINGGELISNEEGCGGVWIQLPSGTTDKKGNLIKQICNYLGIKYNKNSSTDDFLKIPQILYYRLNNDDRKYISLIASYLKCDDSVPNDIHYKMMSLHPNSFVTTNFDELLEQTAMNVCRSYRTVATDSEVPQISGNKYILKIHGDIKHANIVLKEEDYLNYSDNFKLIETQLKSIFATNTVVFIGYGLNDYNIKMALNWTKRLLNDDFKKPIFIYTGAKELTDEELTYQSSRGIRVVETVILIKIAIILFLIKLRNIKIIL